MQNLKKEISYNTQGKLTQMLAFAFVGLCLSMACQPVYTASKAEMLNQPTKQETQNPQFFYESVLTADESSFSSTEWLKQKTEKGHSAHLAYKEIEGEDPHRDVLALADDARRFFDLVNAARTNPKKTLKDCEVCLEKACYKPVPSLKWDDALAQTAHFHALHLVESSCVEHESSCEFKKDLKGCDGHPSCACVDPQKIACASGIDSFDRLKRLQPKTSFSHVGENLVATSGGTLSGEEMMENLYWEKSSNSSCDPKKNSGNGHRINLLNPDFKRMGAAIYCTPRVNAAIRCVGVQVLSD